MKQEHAAKIWPFVKAFGEGETVWFNGDLYGWIKCASPCFSYPVDQYHIGKTPPVPDGSEQVRELLKSGKPVLCGVSTGTGNQDVADSRAGNGYLTHIIHSCDKHGFYLIDRTPFKYACPVDQGAFAWEVK